MGIRAHESEGPERSSALPGAGAYCSCIDSRTAHHSVPHCLAALQAWGLGQQLVQVLNGGGVEAPGWRFFERPDLNGSAMGEASSSAKWVTREAHGTAWRRQQGHSMVPRALLA